MSPIPSLRSLSRLVRSFGGVLLLPLSLLLASGLAAATPRPRLAVIVVVDQLRAVDVDRLEPLFGPGGFAGIGHRGARLTLEYSYAATETGPGHATLATGANPRVHGIGLNRWYADGRWINTVEDPSAPVLGAPEGAPGRGPAKLLVPTLGDAMKAESGGVARVVTIAGKDRSAILMGGHAADLAVWYEPELGYTSSEKYVRALPAWLATLAERRVKESVTRGRWSPLPVPAGLEALIPPDEQAAEQVRMGGTTFPHDLAAMPEAEARKDYRGSPQSIDDVIALGLAAIEHERLGDDAVPDLLVLGISALDYTGHWFGPGSLETTDLLRRLDASLRKLVRALDQRFGRDGYVFAVTADHAATPPPERVLEAGVPASRVPVRAFREALEEALRAALPKGAATKERVLGVHPPHLYLDLADLSQTDRERALAAAQRHLESLPELSAVYRTSELDDAKGPLVERLREAVHPLRAGTLLVVQRPRVLFDFGPMAGTDHGTPYAYDARVPLLLAGPGVRRGRFAEGGDPRDVAPTLAFLLKGPPPDAAQGRPLAFVLER